MDARAGLVVFGLRLLLLPLGKCREAERKDLVFQGDAPVYSWLSGPRASAWAGCLVFRALFPMLSKLSVFTSWLYEGLASPSTVHPGSCCQGALCPCPSGLSSARLFSVLFLMIVPIGWGRCLFLFGVTPPKGHLSLEKKGSSDLLL